MTVVQSKGRRRSSGESNGGITTGALATRVALWKKSRGCEAVIVTMQLINTKFKFKLQSLERQANEYNQVSRRLVTGGTWAAEMR
jgi:hypothetical protein